MRTRQRSAFTTITSEGALLPVDLLQRVAQLDTDLGGMTAESYHYGGERLNEVISDTWTSLLRAWKNFQEALERAPGSVASEKLTRDWLLTLFRKLDYGQLYPVPALEIEGKSYPISHGWQHVPIHLVNATVDLDEVSRNAFNGYRSSPYSLVQELLNRSSEHRWGMVSNGLRLRLLRKNASLTRLAYVEFDLEAMLRGEAYADFTLFWLLCQQSRVEGEQADSCWLEKWMKSAQEQGVRALDRLRAGVEQAINALGSGFLAHGANNQTLKERLRSGELSGQAYYNQVLRLVYRLLILFVAEDRDILLLPDATELAKQRYRDYYSTARLRQLATQRVGTRHTDLFRALWLVMEQLGGDTGCAALGLPALNGFLFSSQRSLPDLIGCELENHALLAAVRALALTFDGPVRRSIDYKNLGAEELGSVYESLLELHPELDAEAATFRLNTASGNERKTSGSYYTPTSLIDCLLDSALDPVLKEAREQPDPERAILALKVCDPACGSGHFLIAAAHRIAKALAATRTGSEEPGPAERRAALRDVIGHCIYGVDINPMTVELCKVNLWMEAIEPGKPLSFLDAHIKPGNSLFGATPYLLHNGIPNAAFEPIEGDERKICSEFKKLNSKLIEGNRSLFREDREEHIWEQQEILMNSMIEMEGMGENTVKEIHNKERFFTDLVRSESYQNALLWANAWCAAFVWKKTGEMRPPITDEEFRDIGKNPFTLAPWRRKEIERLAEQYQFFHWHLAFPEVFRVPNPESDETPENKQAGWSGGFDVVLGNPPYIFGEGHNRNLKHTFQVAFSLAVNQYDMYWLFIEQSSRLTNNKGTFALVVPDALLARDEAQNARLFLLQEGIKHIYHCGMLFKDANVSTIIFSADKRNVSTKIFSGAFVDSKLGEVHESSKELFLADSTNKFLIHISYEETLILARILKNCKMLQNFVKITRGEEIGKKAVLSEGPIPILVGSDISRYHIKQPSRFMNTVEKDSSIYQAPKIVVVKTGNQCIASLELNGHVTMQSVYNMRITVPEIEYEFLLAILNSRLVSYFIYKTFTSNKILFPQLNQSTLQSIPLPQDIEKHQKYLMPLVQNMHRAISAMESAQTLQERNIIQEEIDSIDKSINLLVYHMYNLTADEISLIEKNIV